MGTDYLEYLDLYTDKVGSGEEESDALLTFSISGAHALENNVLWQTLRSKLATGTRRRPGLILKIHLDNNSKDTVFSWCNHENGVESCEEEWRSALT